MVAAVDRRFAPNSTSGGMIKGKAAHPLRRLASNRGVRREAMGDRVITVPFRFFVFSRGSPTIDLIHGGTIGSTEDPVQLVVPDNSLE